MDRELNEQLAQSLTKDKTSSYLWLLLGLLSILFAPATIVGVFCYFLLFRWLKQRVNVNLVYLLLPFLLSSLIFFLIIKQGNWLLSYVTFCIPLGMILAISMMTYRAWQLEKYPQIKFMDGWAYKFEYAPSLFDKWTKNKLVKGLKNGDYNTKEEAPMGILDKAVVLNDGIEYNQIHIVARSYDEANKTTLCTGASGAGKSILMMNLMRNDIIAGYPVFVVDFKKGPDMAWFLSKLAYEMGRPFYHFLSGEPYQYQNPFCRNQASYDPLSTGDATSKADLVLNLRSWDTASEIYKKKTETILRTIFFLLERVPKQKATSIPWGDGGFSQFYAALQPENLAQLIHLFETSVLYRKSTKQELQQLAQVKEFYNELTSSSKGGLKEQIDNLATIVRNITLTNYSYWLTRNYELTKNHINLGAIATSSSAPVVLFQFNSSEEPQNAATLGNLIIQDITRVAAAKQAKGDKRRIGIYIDEYQIANPENIATLVEKCRSVNMFPTLSSQSLEQIVKSAPKDGESVLQSILDTVSNFIVLNGPKGESATRFADLIGKTKRVTYKMTGQMSSSFFNKNRKDSKKVMMSRGEEYEYKVDPAEIESLSSPSKSNGYKSTGYYITKTCSYPPLASQEGTIARKFQSIPHPSVFEEPPLEFVSSLLTSEIKQYDESHSIFNDDNFMIEPIEEEPTNSFEQAMANAKKKKWR